jgi:hypothetical protein
VAGAVSRVVTFRELKLRSWVSLPCDMSVPNMLDRIREHSRIEISPCFSLALSLFVMVGEK